MQLGKGPVTVENQNAQGNSSALIFKEDKPMGCPGSLKMTLWQAKGEVLEL